jgi:hypothetical protein
MTIVARDGFEVIPKIVTNFTIPISQRIDVVQCLQNPICNGLQLCIFEIYNTIPPVFIPNPENIPQIWTEGIISYEDSFTVPSYGIVVF